MSEAMLEIAGLDVSYGGVAAVRGVSIEVGTGRDRRPDRPERRRQVDDAARRHGARRCPPRRDPARRRVAARPLARAGRARGHLARAGGAAHLRRADGRGESPPRPLGAPLARRAPARTSRPSTRCSRSSRSSAGGAPARSRAASSSSSRSRARSSPGPTCCCSTSPRSASRPKIVDVVFETLAEIRERGITVLLVEQRAQRTVAFADRTYLMANGEIRLTLTPADAGRHGARWWRPTSRERPRRTRARVDRRAGDRRRDRPRARPTR